MDCLINTTLQKAIAKGKEFDVVSRYLQWRYRIRVDIRSLRRRAKALYKAEPGVS